MRLFRVPASHDDLFDFAIELLVSFALRPGNWGILNECCDRLRRQ